MKKNLNIYCDVVAVDVKKFQRKSDGKEFAKVLVVPVSEKSDKDVAFPIYSNTFIPSVGQKLVLCVRPWYDFKNDFKLKYVVTLYEHKK